MPKYLLPFVFGLLLSLPIITFIVGYRMGEKPRLLFIQPDASVAHISLDKQIGQVAGTSSSEMKSPRITNENDSPVANVQMGESQDLWQKINAYRKQRNLPEFDQDTILCQWSEIRLTQIQNRGSLDNHDGFREQLHAFLQEKDYHELAENLAQGYSSATDVLSGWDGSTGHKALLESSSLTQGCIASGNGFAVLIAGRK